MRLTLNYQVENVMVGYFSDLLILLEWNEIGRRSVRMYIGDDGNDGDNNLDFE